MKNQLASCHISVLTKLKKKNNPLAYGPVPQGVLSFENHTKRWREYNCCATIDRKTCFLFSALFNNLSHSVHQSPAAAMIHTCRFVEEAQVVFHCCVWRQSHIIVAHHGFKEAKEGGAET